MCGHFLLAFAEEELSSDQNPCYIPLNPGDPKNGLLEALYSWVELGGSSQDW